MGGGSSDAATTLLALNRLWGLNWPLSRLLSLGLALGADVPFFLGGRNAWVEGIGELLTPIDVPPHWFAVVKPSANIATQAIFTSPLLVRDTDAAILVGFLADVKIDGLLRGYGRNDLQPPAEAHSREVAQAAQLLEARFGNSRMTGSGSAVFARAGKIKSAIESVIERAETAVEGMDSRPTATLPTDLPAGWAGRMCRSLERHPLVGWAAD
jgi:4-diphosphocytidyl-2-C-methyl-D-erythritol kinase